MNKKYTYIIFIALIFLSLTVSGCLKSITNELNDQIPEDKTNNPNNNEQETGLKDNETDTKVEKNLECKFIIEQDSYITSNYFQLNISGIKGEYEAFIKDPNNKILDQKQINTEEFQEGNKSFTITLAKNLEIINPGKYKAYVVDDKRETILSTLTIIEPAKPEIIDIEISKSYEESSKGKISGIRIKLMNYGDISTKLNEGIIETNDKKRSLNFQTEKILKPQETSIIKDNIYISDIELGNYDLNIRLFYHTELISQEKISYQITKND